MPTPARAGSGHHTQSKPSLGQVPHASCHLFTTFGNSLAFLLAADCLDLIILWKLPTAQVRFCTLVGLLSCFASSSLAHLHSLLPGCPWAQLLCLHLSSSAQDPEKTHAAQDRFSHHCVKQHFITHKAE